MQYLRGLVQIVLNLGDFVGARRILVLDEIILRGREGGGVYRGGHALPRIARGGDELVEELGEEDEGHSGGVFGVRGDGAGEPVGSDVAVDYVGFVGDGLALAGLGSFGEGFGEEGEHFFDSLALEEAVGGEVAGHAEGDGVGGGLGAEDCDADYFHIVQLFLLLKFK